MSNILITEYSEQVKSAQIQTDLVKDHEHEHEHIHTHDHFEDPGALVITFSEDYGLDEPDLILHETHDLPEIIFNEEIELGELELGDHELKDLESMESNESDESDEDEFKLDEDELMDSGDHESMSFHLPGAVDYVEDDFDEEEEEEVVDDGSTTNWETDRDVRHFMPYIIKKVNTIPTHDGKSTLGCERAILYLSNLNKEISEALRSDPKAYSGKNDDGSPLDIETLEKIRIKILKDITTLKEHIKTLNKKHKKPTKKKAEEENTLVKDGTDSNTEIKIASTPKIQLVMTPFERAITGMIINATVSAGKPLEDVYAQLKEKYDISDREELSIFQLLMDMGQPIYKDRGTLGKESESVDFMKNYFA